MKCATVNDDSNTYTTDDEHFNIFKEEASFWLEWFQLSNWCVSFKHKKLDALAECWTKSQDRVAQLLLSTDWRDEEPLESSIRRSAFHEVCELWLRNLAALGENRYVDPDEISKETHRLIRFLENRVWPKKEALT